MSKRILILDDEIDSNITVEAVLQDNGFKVDSYEDPILALENCPGCPLVIPKYPEPHLHNQILLVQWGMTATEIFR
jgi:hypothetical protein